MTDFVSTWNKDSFLTYPVGPLGLIAMPGTEEMGIKVNSWLKKWQDHTEESMPGDMSTTPGAERQDFLIDVTCPRFGNGEAKGMIKESIRGYDMYILCDPGAYNVEYEMFGRRVPMSPDEHFANLKRIIAAMGGKAKRVTVIMPMLYEGRQHRRSARESLDCAMALQELENMGVSNIITFDAHDPRVQNAIPTTGFESIMPSYQIFKALLKKDKTLRIDKEHMMIVSPDEGAIDRNIFYASVLGLDMGLFYKRRDYTRIVNGRNPIVAHEYLGDSVEGKDVFVADDMLSSGESIIDLAKELKKRKANRIFAGCTFALFTNGIDAFEEAYRNGFIDRVISTNLTYRKPELAETEWFIEADMSKYISFIIATLNHDRSLSKLLNPYDRIHALLKRYNNEQMAAGMRLI
ncbi:ribose-phosphate pyrophosphokinase [Aristaeella hokkaidonensis]|uniref:Ribose-phosphate pyrophosphokinase n=1 Tax=Aristaeella hokkaidonensis TaxID=3046382 RepID=A0AC61N6C5_9FIRM|nr:ribose-phosphate pyrophosphokinase [Aristaeella hokkaidonensis]QUC67351.1 ribose-phosphate pyrophosphokinase [Aristaeella hokkaidonensis]SNT93311.1 ribose-phosphate pyrophosphokinase [Aristaeella hokkaidonensis]